MLASGLGFVCADVCGVWGWCVLLCVFLRFGQCVCVAWVDDGLRQDTLVFLATILTHVLAEDTLFAKGVHGFERRP